MEYCTESEHLQADTAFTPCAMARTQYLENPIKTLNDGIQVYSLKDRAVDTRPSFRDLVRWSSGDRRPGGEDIVGLRSDSRLIFFASVVSSEKSGTRRDTGKFMMVFENGYSCAESSFMYAMSFKLFLLCKFHHPRALCGLPQWTPTQMISFDTPPPPVHPLLATSPAAPHSSIPVLATPVKQQSRLLALSVQTMRRLRNQDLYHSYPLLVL